MIIEKGNEPGERYYECTVCGATSFGDDSIEHKEDCNETYDQGESKERQ